MVATRGRRRAAGREPLTRDRVLRAAVALADERGAGELTMRKVAGELGVEAMSLYNHVANKRDLVDAMIEIVFSEIETPAVDGEWKAEMRKRAASTRDALRRHRWAIGQMEGRTNFGEANMRNRDAFLGCLRRAGFSVALTIQANSVQDAYIYGFAVQESDMASETPEDFAAEAQRQAALYEERLADLPHLREIVVGHVAEVGHDFDSAFAFGLDVILDGLERLLETE